MNMALLCNWWWRFLTNPELQWCKIIRGLYYRKRIPLGEGRSFRSGSHWWRDVLSTRDIFKGGTSFRIGDGKLVSFWTDRWCGKVTLHSQFPELYNVIVRKSIKVSECIDQGRWRWRKILRGAYGRGPGGRERVNELKTLVWTASLESHRDEPVWRWNSKGFFTVKSAYTFLIDGGVRDPAASSIWRLGLPVKVKIFLWIALKNRLPTVDNLLRKGWSGNNLCVLCGVVLETADHLFTECVYSRFVFGVGDRAVDIRGVGNSVRRVWDSNALGVSASDMDSGRTHVAVFWWVLWLIRNKIIFQRVNTDPLQAARWARDVLAQWSGNG